MVRFEVSPERRATAKSQRSAQTTIESLIWRELRAKRFQGLKFKRQVPIGPFIADFACFEARLIIEVDGPDHEKPLRKERDRHRDTWLREQGFSVFRITGEEVIGGLDLALARLKMALQPPSPASLRSAPSPASGRGPASAQAKAEALIRRYYDAFNAGDAQGMLACLADGVRHDVNQGGTRVGKKLFAEFCAHMARCYKERLTDIVIMASEDGRRAAAEFTVHGEYLSTDEGLPPAEGQRYVLPAGTFFELGDGLISRVTTYYNLADWTAQVMGTGKAAGARG